MRTVIDMDDGGQLTIYTLNKAGQQLLGFVLPELFEHMGTDVVENLHTIL